MTAAQFAEDPAIFTLLLKAEADVNAKDKVKDWEGGSLGCVVCVCVCGEIASAS